MTNNEILQADLLDILFEHRNKQYGAYVLRRNYNNRLATALGISFSVVLMFVFFSLLKKSNRQNNPWDDPDKNLVVVSSVAIPKPAEPDQPKPVEKPKPVAAADFQTVTIVPDDKVTETLVTNDELKDKAISDANVDGPPPQDLNKAVTSNPEVAMGEEKVQPKENEPFDPIEMQPSFPGGPAALALFFSRNINPPSDLEPGEKKWCS
jgi:periplasmic protein TonB